MGVCHSHLVCGISDSSAFATPNNLLNFDLTKSKRELPNSATATASSSSESKDDCTFESFTTGEVMIKSCSFKKCWPPSGTADNGHSLCNPNNPSSADNNTTEAYNPLLAIFNDPTKANKPIPVTSIQPHFIPYEFRVIFQVPGDVSHVKVVFTRDVGIYEETRVGCKFTLSRTSDLRTGGMEQISCRHYNQNQNQGAKNLPVEQEFSFELEIPKSLGDRKVSGYFLDEENIVLAKAQGIVVDDEDLKFSETLEKVTTLERTSRTKGVERLSQFANNNVQSNNGPVVVDGGGEDSRAGGLRETLRALSKIKKSRVEFLESSDGVKLAYRCYTPEQEMQAVFSNNSHFHDIVASRIAQSFPITSYILELRGYGYSGGERGRSPSKEQIWIDIKIFISYIRMNYDSVPIILGGHFYHGGLVLNYSNWKDKEPVDGYIIISPDFGGETRQDSLESAASNNNKKNLYKEERKITRIKGDPPKSAFKGGNNTLIQEEYSADEHAVNPMIVDTVSLNVAKACACYNNTKKLFETINRPFGLFIGELERELLEGGDKNMLTYASLSEVQKKIEVVKGLNHFGLLNAAHNYIGSFIMSLDIVKICKSLSKNTTTNTLNNMSLSIATINNNESSKQQTEKDINREGKRNSMTFSALGGEELFRDFNLVLKAFLSLSLYREMKPRYIAGVGGGGRICYHVFSHPTISGSGGGKPSANIVLLQSGMKCLMGYILAQKYDITVHVLELLGIDNDSLLFNTSNSGNTFSAASSLYNNNSEREALFQGVKLLIRHVKNNNPDVPILLGGHGIGASIALLYSGWKQREPVNGYIFISPIFGITRKGAASSSSAASNATSTNTLTNTNVVNNVKSSSNTVVSSSTVNGTNNNGGIKSTPLRRVASSSSATSTIGVSSSVHSTYSSSFNFNEPIMNADNLKMFLSLYNHNHGSTSSKRRGLSGLFPRDGRDSGFSSTTLSSSSNTFSQVNNASSASITNNPNVLDLCIWSPMLNHALVESFLFYSNSFSSRNLIKQLFELDVPFGLWIGAEDELYLKGEDGNIGSGASNLISHLTGIKRSMGSYPKSSTLSSNPTRKQQAQMLNECEIIPFSFHFTTLITSTAFIIPWLKRFVKIVTPTLSFRLSDRSSTLDDFERLQFIGKGSFGRVYLVRHIASNKYYALKVLTKSEIYASKEVRHVISERNILRQMNSPFIVSYVCSFQDKKHLYLVMEYVPGGELFTQLVLRKRFSNAVAKFYAAEVVLFFEEIHSRGIVYRDLKPENILLDSMGHVKITDFGFAKYLTTMHDRSSGGVGSGRASSFCGTPQYIAPEMIISAEMNNKANNNNNNNNASNNNNNTSNGYGIKVDYWSFGILLYEMLVGQTPFHDTSPRAIYKRILYAPVEFPCWSSVDPMARDLIKRLLVKNPLQRLAPSPEQQQQNSSNSTGINNLAGAAGQTNTSNSAPLSASSSSISSNITTPFSSCTSPMAAIEEIKKHRWFKGIDWDLLRKRQVPAPFVPRILHPGDTSNFVPPPQEKKKKKKPVAATTAAITNNNNTSSKKNETAKENNNDNGENNHHDLTSDEECESNNDFQEAFKDF